MEFWCSVGGSGCGGYFRAPLRTNCNGDYTLICPNCGHEHNRRIENGVITADRCNSEATRGLTVRVHVPKAAFSMEPVLEKVGSTSEQSRPVENNSERSKIVRSSLWDRFKNRFGRS